MSTMGQHRSPIIARPWFAAFAMVLGMSAMALAAYTVENPLAFTSKTLPAAPAPPQAAIVRKMELSPASVQAATPVIVLDEMRITANVERQATPHAARADACAPNWRPLANGPATRQVSDYCPTPSEANSQPGMSPNPNDGATERLTAPRVQHERLGAIEELSRRNSLKDLVPST